MLGDPAAVQPTSRSRSSAAAVRSSATSRRSWRASSTRRCTATRCATSSSVQAPAGRSPSRVSIAASTGPPSDGGGLVRSSQAPVRTGERGAHDRAVGSEVGRRHQAAASGHVGREQPGRARRRTASGRPARRSGTASRPARRSASGRRSRPSLRRVGAEPAPSRGPSRRCSRGRTGGSSPTPTPSGKPVAGDLGGRRHHLGPRQCPEPRLGQVEGGQRAGDRRGARADRHGHAAAVAGAHLLHSTPAPSGRSRPGMAT